MWAKVKRKTTPLLLSINQNVRKRLESCEQKHKCQKVTNDMPARHWPGMSTSRWRVLLHNRTKTKHRQIFWCLYRQYQHNNATIQQSTKLIQCISPCPKWSSLSNRRNATCPSTSVTNSWRNKLHSTQRFLEGGAVSRISKTIYWEAENFDVREAPSKKYQLPKI